MPLLDQVGPVRTPVGARSPVASARCACEHRPPRMALPGRMQAGRRSVLLRCLCEWRREQRGQGGESAESAPFLALFLGLGGHLKLLACQYAALMQASQHAKTVLGFKLLMLCARAGLLDTARGDTSSEVVSQLQANSVPAAVTHTWVPRRLSARHRRMRAVRASPMCPCSHGRSTFEPDPRAHWTVRRCERTWL